MEIALFSQCIKDLILENDRVDVPYLGTFTAEMMPATYSDRQTTIHPPYRKMSFHKDAVALADEACLHAVASERVLQLRRQGGVVSDGIHSCRHWSKVLGCLCHELLHRLLKFRILAFQEGESILLLGGAAGVGAE